MALYNENIDLDNYFKSGWNNWKKYIDRYNNKKINCLDIGANTGYITSWLLNNCCDNPHSVVFSLDIWDQLDHSIEDMFDYNIGLTDKLDYNVKLKMNYEEGILKFKNFGVVTFDLIFINIKDNKNNILSNALLAWDLIDLYGLLIFDNYSETILDIDTKKIIESFIFLFKLQLVVKYTDNQYIIKKIRRKNDDKPELIEYYNLLEEINNYKFIQINEEFSEDIKENLNIELIYLDNTIEYNNTYINDLLQKINIILKDENIKIFFNKIYYNYLNIIFDDKNYNYFLNKFNIVKHKKITHQYKYIYLSKYIKLDDNIFINDRINKEDILLYISKDVKTNINYKVDIFNDYIINIDNFNKIKNNNNKYDIIFFELSYIDNKNEYIKYNSNINYILYIIYSILALNIQSYDGILIIKTKLNINIYNIIYILKKYYKYIRFINENIKLSGSLKIICKQFIGISKNELNYFNNLLDSILKNIGRTNEKLVLKINNINTDDLYNRYINIIKKFILIFYNNLLLFNKINLLKININNNNYLKNIYDIYLKKKNILNIINSVYD